MKALSPDINTVCTLTLDFRSFEGETESSAGRTSTDQVIICMLGLEHSCDVLQVVRVDLLWATPGEGHSDDTFCDVRQVEFISFLHPELWDFLLKIMKQRHRRLRPFNYVTPFLLWAGDFAQVNIWQSKSSVLNFPADVDKEWPSDGLTEGVSFVQKQSTVCVTNTFLFAPTQYMKGFLTCDEMTATYLYCKNIQCSSIKDWTPAI